MHELARLGAIWAQQDGGTIDRRALLLKLGAGLTLAASTPGIARAEPDAVETSDGRERISRWCVAQQSTSTTATVAGSSSRANITWYCASVVTASPARVFRTHWSRCCGRNSESARGALPFPPGRRPTPVTARAR